MSRDDEDEVDSCGRLILIYDVFTGFWDGYYCVLDVKSINCINFCKFIDLRRFTV